MSSPTCRSRTTRSSPAPAATPTPARLPSRRRTAATGSPRRPPRPGLVREAAERAAREKERKALEAKRDAIIARAKDDPRAAARVLLPEYGWDDSQFSCLDNLWEGESGWNYRAENPSSGAYGIPQSLPGSKMASVAPDWRENPVTQITWGLQYIESRYGSPCSARAQWQSRSPHWY